MANENDKTIEESFEILEDIIGQMEAGDVSLEQSFLLYKTGIEELKNANSKIDQTKKAVMALGKDGALEIFEGDNE